MDRLRASRFGDCTRAACDAIQPGARVGPLRKRFAKSFVSKMTLNPTVVPVFVLCGGQGTRFREQTEFRPKPMIEIGGRPILWHIMHVYARHGFKRFVLCL